MIDYPRIVDDLRSAVLSANPDWADFLRAAAADYSVACEEVNERLRKCGEYLRKGLRSEAIQQADIEPNLLDCVAILDFPEREPCNYVLQQYGIRAPQPLMLEIAAELNEAYAIEQPMTALLKEHRRLALAHAPLKERVAVLQQIAQVDENNPVWREDLIGFEQVRMKEIRRDAANALKEGDFLHIAELHKELLEQPWLEAPPETLVQQLAGARNHLYHQLGREELVRVASQLHEAYSSFDLGQAQAARDRWQQVAADIVLNDADPLWVEVAPIFQWLAQEELRNEEEANFHHAVAALEQALNRNASSEELGRAYLTVARHQREISDVLENRYRHHLEQHQVQKVRRRRLIVAGTVTSVLVVVLAGIAGVYFWSLASQTEAHATELSVLLTENKLEEADAYLKKLTQDAPHIAASPEVQKRARTLQSRQREEEDRHQEFESELTALAAEINARRPDEHRLNQLLSRAKRSDERRRAQQLAREHQALLRTLQEARDRTAREKVEAIAKRLETLDMDGSQSTAASRTALRALQAETSIAAEAARSASAEVHARLAEVKARIDVLERQLTEREDRQNALAKITRNVGDPKMFAAALTTYTRQFPEGARATDFRKASSESQHWETIDQWNALAGLWAQKNLLTITAADAVDLTQRTNQYLEKLSSLDGTDALKARLLYLQRIPLRFGGDDSLEAKMHRLCNDPLVTGLWQFVHSDGRIFYGKTEPKTNGGATIGYRYICDFSFTEKNVGLREGDIMRKCTAPQVTLAKALDGLFDGLTDRNWDATFLKALQEIEATAELEATTGIDPIFKLELLKRTYDAGREGSLLFEHVFSEYGERLNPDSDLEFVNFLDPDTDGLARGRQAARETLAKLPDLSKLRERAAAEVALLRKPIGLKYTWIGWLHRHGDATWVGEFSHMPGGGGSLSICTEEAGRLQLVQVGTLVDGQPQINADHPQALVEGRPLYFAMESN